MLQRLLTFLAVVLLARAQSGTPLAPACPANENFDACVRCEATCTAMIAVCPTSPCVAKCTCNLGTVRSANGTCIFWMGCIAMNGAAMGSIGSVGGSVGGSLGSLADVPALPTLPTLPPFANMPTFPTLPPLNLNNLFVTTVAPFPAGLPATTTPLIPGASAVSCPANEAFGACSRCEATCAQPFPICSAAEPCVAKCQCSLGFVRSITGACVMLAQCPFAAAPTIPGFPNTMISLTTPLSLPLTSTFPTIPTNPITPQCPLNEAFQQCVRCEATCAQPMPICATSPCVAKCQCNVGFVRNALGSCVFLTQCMESLTTPTAVLGLAPASTPQCPTNESFQTCVRCEGTCSDPFPVCFNAPCVTKCACNVFYVRDAAGVCTLPWTCNAGTPTAAGVGGLLPPITTTVTPFAPVVPPVVLPTLPPMFTTTTAFVG